MVTAGSRGRNQSSRNIQRQVTVLVAKGTQAAVMQCREDQELLRCRDTVRRDFSGTVSVIWSFWSSSGKEKLGTV